MHKPKLLQDESIWRSIARALPWIAAASLLTTQLHNVGWLRPLESTALDALIRLNPMAARHVFVVGIRNSDYDKLFAGQSPLNPDKVAELIGAIAAGNPSVIVVDLDTSDERFAGIKLPKTSAKIVWASAAAPDLQEDPIGKGRASANVIAAPARVLGRRVDETSDKTSLLWGPAALPQDPDGVIRHYCRFLPVPARLKPGRLEPVLSWQAVLAFRNAQPVHATALPMVLCSSGGPGYLSRISAGDLLSIYKEQGWKDLAGGKIILLGGYYAAARDSYLTSAGRMAGVDIQAEAIESELCRGGIRDAGTFVLLAAQILASVAVVALNSRCAGSFSPVLGLIIVLPAAFLASLVAFSSLYMWADFVPVLFTVQLHYLVEHVRHVRQNNIALAQANEDLKNTTLELARAIDRGAEQERKRLAHELHDDTLGQLFAAAASLAPVIAGCPDGTEAARALSTIEQAQGNLRRSLMNLYPPVLERYGFCAALEDLISCLKDRSIQVELVDTTVKAADNFSKDTQLCLYRIAQESINNIIKHAGANKVKIVMSASKGIFTLSLTDNGKGMAGAGQRKDSYGLYGMKNKAELIGAEILWICPVPGQGGGCRVCLTMPLPC